MTKMAWRTQSRAASDPVSDSRLELVLFPKIFRVVLVALLGAAPLHAALVERVTLSSGFELDCLHREVLDSGRVRLFTSPQNYVEVDATAIRSVTQMEVADHAPVQAKTTNSSAATPHVEISSLLKSAEARHNVDSDLLASVVRAESGGHNHAISRTGAQGLMQLMPGTAKNLGVTNSFEPEQNINGGSAYLDQLLTRYHNNVQLALAAYNAGPGAVDRYHGVPPYRETRAYVARVINEFNRRKKAQQHLMAAAARGE